MFIYSTFNFSYKLSKQIILKENKEYECALIDIITDNITTPDLSCVLYYDGFIIHTIRLLASNGETFFSIINKINKSDMLLEVNLDLFVKLKRKSI